MLMLAAALLLAASDVSVSIEIEVLKPLKLKKGELTGALAVRIKNNGSEPVQLRHRDVHGFRFTPVAGGAPSVIFHSCDCAFELGIEPSLKQRTFTLAPKEDRLLLFEDFTCNGGPHRAPAKGAYTLTYQVTVVAPEATPPARGTALDFKECERLLLSRKGLDSPAIAIKVQ